jgi:hypothetical protein
MGTWRIVAGAAALSLLVGACGDDDDAAEETTTTEAPEETTTTTEAEDDEEAGADGVNPEFAEYCAAVADISEDEAPTVEQMEAVRAAAPDEIATEVETLAGRFIEAIESGDFDSLFDDQELTDEFAAVEAFEAENCGTVDDGEEATGEINPEFAEYCALAIELDAQQDFASEEQLNEILAVAPDEIRAEAEVVVAGFLEAYATGSPEAAFENPDVIENLGVIEAFEEENCGLDHSDN